MPVCIVKGCTNRSSVKSRQQEEFEKTMKITLHAFPKCPTKRQLWLNSLGLQNSVVPKYPAVCSVHFRHEDLDRTSLVCVRLKENAIPYVKLPEIREENINAYKEISTDEPSTSACSHSYNTSSAVIKLETDDSVGFTEPMSIAGGMKRHLVNTGSHDVSEEVLKIESEFKNEHVGAILQSNKSTEAKVSSVDKCTCISPTRLFNSPTKQMLREHISKMKRRHQLELKAVRETNRRKDRKITDLQTRLQTLKKKNFLEEESKSIPSQVFRNSIVNCLNA